MYEKEKEMTLIPKSMCETIYKNILEKHNLEQIRSDEVFEVTQMAVYRKELPYAETKDKELWQLAQDFDDVRREFTIEVELLYGGE